MTTDLHYSARLLLPSLDNGQQRRYRIIKELTRSEFDRYEEAYEYINDILNLNIFTYLQTTLLGFNSALQKDMEEMAKGDFDFEGQDDIVRTGIRMRSAVLAFCTALHFHQDHTYTEILLTNDKSSLLFRQVQKVFNRLYEKSAEYRLLYHTRNTMVHSTMDTVKINAGWKLDPAGEVQYWTNPQIDVGAISQLNTRISDSYRRELAGYAEDPSVVECVTKVYPLIKDANDRILARMYPDISDNCAIIREFDDLFGNREGVRAPTKASALNGPRNYTQKGWASNVIAYARNKNTIP